MSMLSPAGQWRTAQGLWCSAVSAAAWTCRVISKARSSARFADSPLTTGVECARTHSTKCCSSSLSGSSFAIGTGSPEDRSKELRNLPAAHHEDERSAHHIKCHHVGVRGFPNRLCFVDPANAEAHACTYKAVQQDDLDAD